MDKPSRAPLDGLFFKRSKVGKKLAVKTKMGKEAKKMSDKKNILVS